MASSKKSENVSIPPTSRRNRLPAATLAADSLPVILKNQTGAVPVRGAAGNHWLRIKVIGAESNRDGFGARVQIKTGDLTQTAEVRANSSFESASDPRLHFGLGRVRKVDSITVHWPSGKTDIT